MCIVTDREIGGEILRLSAKLRSVVRHMAGVRFAGESSVALRERTQTGIKVLKRLLSIRKMDGIK
jgi:hypothetical protein